MRTKYHRMTGEQLKAAINELGLSYDEFAYLTGAQARNVGQWVHNHLDIPHHIRLCCVMLAQPGNTMIARLLTEAVELSDEEIEAEKETADV